MGSGGREGVPDGFGEDVGYHATHPDRSVLAAATAPPEARPREGDDPIPDDVPHPPSVDNHPRPHPRPHRRAGPLDVVAAAALFVLVPVIAAGGLVTKPLNEAGLTGLVFGVVAAASLPALWGSRWWRHPAPLLLALFWALFWALAPRALAAAPDGRLGRKELAGLAVCTFVSVAAVILSRGRRPGVAAFRWGWVVSLLLTGGIGVWELVTGHHLWTPDWAPWRFTEGVISSTFINPNNFSDALVGMFAGVVALWAATPGSRRALRAILGGLALFAVALMLLTQSRGGLVGLVVIATLELLRRRRLATGARPLREVLRAHPRAVAAAAAGVLVLIAATFLVPALAARNPIRATIDIALSPGQGRADALRVSLVRSAVGYLRDSGWAGSGAGSFEPLFWNDPARGGLPATNLHNAFVELLTQYGVLVFAPYAALLLVLVGALWLRTGRRGRGRGEADARRPERDPAARERVIVRNELAGQLTAFVLLGATASSALEIPFWWLSLANAVALAWYLHSLRPDAAPEAAARA